MLESSIIFDSVDENIESRLTDLNPAQATRIDPQWLGGFLVWL
jgi:hypothetical protein